jgi:hypothetical protein
MTLTGASVFITAVPITTGSSVRVYYCSYCVCVHYCSTYYKAVRVGGGG